MEKQKLIILNFLKKLSHVATYVMVLVIGLLVGYYYYALMDKRIKESPIVNVKTLKETSIGFTERQELMLIDRRTGRYTVYEDSIGIVIFSLYANQKYKEVLE